MKFKIKDKSNNSVHNARKISEDIDGTVSVWSDTWQGRHVIGRDCEFVEGDPKTTTTKSKKYWIAVNERTGEITKMEDGTIAIYPTKITITASSKKHVPVRATLTWEV